MRYKLVTIPEPHYEDGGPKARGFDRILGITIDATDTWKGNPDRHPDRASQFYTGQVAVGGELCGDGPSDPRIRRENGPRRQRPDRLATRRHQEPHHRLANAYCKP